MYEFSRLDGCLLVGGPSDVLLSGACRRGNSPRHRPHERAAGTWAALFVEFFVISYAKDCYCLV